MSNKTNKYLIYIVFLEKDINSGSAPSLNSKSLKSKRQGNNLAAKQIPHPRLGDPVGSSPTRWGANPV